MSNPIYLDYDDFVETIHDLLPRLPKILQNRFNREIVNETYGTPTAPKDGTLLKYAMGEGNEEQTISPLSILIECVSSLYKAMHNLGPFASRIELGKGMRARVVLFLANEEWDVNCILDLKIEGLVEAAWNIERHYHPVKSEAPTSARGNTPTLDLNVTSCHLVGYEATPGPTPELNAIINHHLKVLSGLNDRMKWDKRDLLDPREVSVHVWQCKIFTLLSVVPFTRNVLNRKVVTFEDADSILSSIIMHSFSNKLCTEYFAEYGDRPIPIAVDLFEWALNKCKAYSTAKEYELCSATYGLCWDQIGSHAYDFLTKWEAHVSELHTYLQEPWTLDYHYRTLKHALPSDKNALFNSVFILHEKLNGKDQTAESVADILSQCYELAAESAPVHLSPIAKVSELTALRAATLINCWACGDLGHVANRCPDAEAHA
ncbi:uncharacterized protein UHO2_00324 [Ustilago hordei]|uniref:uncharacterized protein n=1 Tax=Ustilago hordei TaxID=120017 RepID=UPI001A5FFA15|nr:uncharacterized protein UHO2_00324 [Ustilago hordei]SYW81819.1 uncharacterized protein UHO2_00324 [Ustilago hordei]